jgi:hypothetical protein
MKVLISLFDLTGNASLPYKENGWEVIQVDKQLGKKSATPDILEWDFRAFFIGNFGTFSGKYKFPDDLQIGIIAMVPCTDYALSGSRHFAAKDGDGRTAQSQKLVAKTKEIIDFLDNIGVLKFWQIENPMSRIHTLNTWMGRPTQKFDPCDFAGYDPEPDNSRYNKKTWLWGRFKQMVPKRLEPISKENPGWKKYGGKSLKTKNARSVTPLGFAYAFYEANH